MTITKFVFFDFLKRVLILNLIGLLFFPILSLNAGSPLDNVKYIIPNGWELKSRKVDDSKAVLVYDIRTEIIYGKQCPCFSLLQSYYLPDSITLRYADDIVSQHILKISKAHYVLSAQDGEYWKTYLFIGDERSVQIILLYRIGIFKGTSFEVMMAFPNKKSVDSTHKDLKVLSLNSDYVIDQNMRGIAVDSHYVGHLLDDFNSFCNSIEIYDQKLFKAKFILLDPPDSANVFRDSTIEH
ncbi:MAG: hypothetical protein ACHQQQ_06780 [Bacteroidota bacterium]